MRLLRALATGAVVTVLGAVGATGAAAHQTDASTRVVEPTAAEAAAAPAWVSPLPCGETWTYATYPGHNVNALDFVNGNGRTLGAPLPASAAGTVRTVAFEAGGAGNYVVIDHGGGWTSHYFHLDTVTTSVGAPVATGDQIGTVGTTGGSTGPHLHFEQRFENAAQPIVLDGVALEYPDSYGQRSITSTNCGGGGEPPTGTPFPTWGGAVNVRAEPTTTSAVVGSVPGPTTVTVECQVQGETVTADGYTSDWWVRLAGYGGYMTSIYIDHPDPQLPGVPLC